MARRQTDTRKWSKEWFKKLSPRLKCFWLFLCDECDHAGFWDENYDDASRAVGGEPLRREDLAVFGSRVIRIDDDTIWIRRFVEFQYSVGTGARQEKLNPKNNAHKGVIRRLEAKGIDSEPWIEFIPAKLELVHKAARQVGPPQPLSSPTEERRDVDVKNEEGGSGGETPDNLKAAPEPPAAALARAAAHAPAQER